MGYQCESSGRREVPRRLHSLTNPSGREKLNTRFEFPAPHHEMPCRRS